MVSTTLTLLALSAAVFAHPSHNKRQHHHHFHGGSGVGTGLPIPTGGLFRFNGTGPFNGSEFGAGPSGTPAVTLTVLPLPAAASTPDASIASPSVGDAAAEVSPAAVSSTSCSSSSTTTTTMTSLQYFTVTVSGESTPASSVDGSVTVSEDSSPVSSLSSPTSSAAVSATAVSAGAFFGQPSGTFSFGGPSSSSSVATTFATMPSAVSSAPSSPVASSVTVSSVASPQASVVASSSTPSASSTPVSTVTASSGKKGLSYNTASLTDAFAGTGISWAYNWAASEQGTIVSGAEYVPMLWGLDATSGWASAAQSAISSGSSHALSFNEPDLSSQSNISPSDAAANHITYMNPLAGSVQIGSPAITNGVGSSPPMGTTWLQQFFTACNGQCKVDFVAFHWYNDASLIEDLKTHVQDVITTAQNNGVSKVWLTEFGATGTDDAVASFLSEAIEFLDSTAAVERYAYFMCSDGILVSGTSLSSLGETYAA